MQTPSKALALAGALASLGGFVRAQTVLTVGPTGLFPDLQQAGCAMGLVTGDFILDVDPAGSPYESFAIDRTNTAGALTLTVRPTPGSSAKIVVRSSAPIACSFAPPEQKSVVVRGQSDTHTVVTLEDLIIDRDAATGTRGGIEATSAYLGLTRCLVQNATDSGLAVTGPAASVEILDSAFTANAGNVGGAVRLVGGALVTAHGSVFLANHAFSVGGGGGEGGGFYIDDQNADNHLLVRASRIEANTADASGGGVLVAGTNSSTAVFEQTAFLGNEAARGFDGGGAHLTREVNVTITDCVFDGNKAPNGLGGGVFLWDVVSPAAAITNTLFAANEAMDGGGAHITNSLATANYCTFADNVASGTGGAAFVGTNVLTLGNSIVWRNTAPTAASIQGGFASADPNIVEGVVGTDPLFTSDRGEPFVGANDLGELDRIYTSPGYYLANGSPAIDAGATHTCTPTSTDICIRTTVPSEVLDDDGTSDLGFHYRAPLKGTHSPFAVATGDETYDLPVGATAIFLLRVGPATAAAAPGQPRFWATVGSATPGTFVYNGLTFGMIPDGVTQAIFNATIPGAIGVLTDAQGIVQLALPIPAQGSLVGVSLYLSGWAIEQRLNPSGVLIPVDVGPEGDPVLNRLELRLTH